MAMALLFIILGLYAVLIGVFIALNHSGAHKALDEDRYELWVYPLPYSEWVGMDAEDVIRYRELCRADLGISPLPEETRRHYRENWVPIGTERA